MPKISIQVCCYNSEKYLETTLSSIAAQTFKDWELIVVNDGSTDGTENIIKKFIKTGLPIIYHYQKNKGFAAARNKAVSLSTGKWIALLDSEDYWVPEKLFIQAEALARYPDTKLYFSNSLWFNDAGKILQYTLEEDRFKTGYIEDSFDKLLTQGCFVDTETVLIDKEAILACGGFNEGYKYIADYDMFVKIAYDCKKFYYENKFLAKWRVHPAQLSQSKKDVMFKEYVDLFESVLSHYNVPLPVKRKCRQIIAYNRLKYAIENLKHRRVALFLKNCIRVNYLRLADFFLLKCILKIKRLCH